MASGSVVPQSYIRCLQITGLFPYKTESGSLRKLDTVRLSYSLAAWSAVVMSMITLFVFTYADDYMRAFSIQVAEMEFFTLVTGVFRNSTMIFGPVFLLFMIWHGREIPQIVATVDELTETILCKKQLKRLWAAPYVVLLWHLMYAGLVIFTTIKHRLTDDWFGIDYIFFDFLAVPNVVSVTLFAIGKVACILMQILPNGLVMLLTFAIAECFAAVSNKLLIAKEIGPKEGLASVMDATLQTYRKLHLALSDVNDTFSVFVLLICLQEFIACVAFIATMLQGIVADDTAQKLFGRYMPDTSFMTFVYCYTGMCVLNAGLRTGVSLWCFSQSQCMKRIAKELVVKFPQDSSISERAKAVENEISLNVDALSAGQCFHLTPEYLSACFGLLLTYFLLIYQTRDAKKDLESMYMALRNRSHGSKLDFAKP